jgi:hypothetical protein
MATAYHEVSHAACCLAIDVGFDSVQIRELQDQVVGEVANPVGDAVGTAISALAGAAGEAMHSGADVVDLLLCSSAADDIGELVSSGAVDDDIEAARRTLARIGKATPEACAWLLPIATAILQRQAALVERIAGELVRTRYLARTEVMALADAQRGRAQPPRSGGCGDPPIPAPRAISGDFGGLSAAFLVVQF